VVVLQEGRVCFACFTPLLLAARFLVEEAEDRIGKRARDRVRVEDDLIVPPWIGMVLLLL